MTSRALAGIARLRARGGHGDLAPGGRVAIESRSSREPRTRRPHPAFPQHTVYLVVETDDIAKLHAFLKPGAGVTTAEVVPVSDTPVA